MEAMKLPLTAGLLAHVDAGKTTLSEAMLYAGGSRRSLGRVDHGDAFLDTHALERSRGITIFSKQARLETRHRKIVLVDTPGHVDFSPETERVLPILDCAVLVISGTGGIQAHTVTLWNLLKRYNVPVFLFVSKMDLPGKTHQELLDELTKHMGSGIVDMTAPWEQVQEQAAMCDEALLEQYLESGQVTDGNIRELTASRKLFPCCFGSGLKLEGVDTLLEMLDRFAPQPEYSEAFGAKIFKISRDAQGNRLTWLKVTGGTLVPRSPLSYVTPEGERVQEKPQQLRLYSGEKFTPAEQAGPGELVGVTGLSRTYAGQGLGAEPGAAPAALEPVMTYRVQVAGDKLLAMPKLLQLEEEEPQLHLLWDEDLKEIFVQIMGKVQLEIFRELVKERFSMDITLDSGRICYRETILEPVEGVGHFEPLRHYAEVHLLLEPLPQGSGLEFATVCPTDVLEPGFQNLVLTHLGEKVHRGVLTGSPITDMKITLLVGKAHLKHTEGGDFRQATYRALRQGLMKAKSRLLEPWYQFSLTVPAAQVGRAITDIRAMGGEFGPPETGTETAMLQGIVPASEVGDYAAQVAAYTRGMGQLQLALDGYRPCHNEKQVIEAQAYNPEGDLPNTPDSVFCSHGAGFTVKWNQVEEYMHLQSPLKKPEPAMITRNIHLDDKELEAIMEREFGPIKRPLYKAPENRPAREEVPIRPPRQQALIVDGYNMIFGWESLKTMAKEDLDGARRRLIDWLSSYAGFKKCYVVLVFDGYLRKGNPGEKEQAHTLQIVYTPEGQTADAYIQELAHRIGGSYQVRVASSDGMIQLSSLGSGVLRMPARELEQEVEQTRKQMEQFYTSQSGK